MNETHTTQPFGPFFPLIFTVAKWICRLLHPVTVQGLENLPRHGALLVANHASNWDPLVLATALPMDYRLRVMGKEELFRNPKTDEARKLVFSGRTQIKEMKGKRLVRVTFREKSSFEPVIANLVLTYRTPVNILYADTKNINGQAQGEMILQLPELEEVADKMIQYLKEINMGVEELKEDVG